MEEKRKPGRPRQLETVRQTTINLTEEMTRRLDEIGEQAGKSRSDLLREGAEMVIARHQAGEKK